MSEYYSINKFSKILGVSAQTLRDWDKNGKLHLETDIDRIPVNSSIGEWR